MSDTNHRLTLISPARIALIYALFAVLWILLSDRALHVMGLEPERSSRIQTVKGVVFVLGSAVLLFVLTRAATGQARRAERLAQEHDERYRGLVETSPDGVFISSDRKIVFVNPAFARMLGAATPDDLLGRDVLSFIHPDYHEIVRDRIRRLYENHEAVPLIQERFQHADGSWVPVEIAASPFTYEGRPAAQVVVRDVSERARAERALRESEHRFRKMAANIPGAIFRYILAPDGTDRLDYMSPGCLAIWEADAEEIGKSASLLWEVIDADYVEGMKESVELSATTGQPWSFAWRITTRAGTRKWLQGFGHPERFPDGSVVWDSVIFDITENKQAQEAMHAAERRLNFVLQNSTDGFLIIDSRFLIRTANPAFDRMVGQPAGSSVGKGLFEVLPKSVDSMWKRLFQAVIETGKAERVESYCEVLEKWFDARVSPAQDGLAIFLSDITDRKRAEQRQQLMMRELDHRVKNNLAAVLAITESSLRDADSLDQFSKSFVGRIRAMAAMHSLLAEQRWEGVGLLSMLHKVVAPYATDHSPNRISMTGPDLLLPSNAAPAICMTVHELATNAAKHGALSSEHGRVEIAWEFDPNSRDFRFRWAERAGPPVPENIEPGFGMDLLQGVVPYELDGETTVRFTREGLEATIFVPGASMRAAAVISHPTPEASS
ncbi:MAG: PAS domain S-box protein [Phycisphaeraceae bacterium]|nr:PAS domain S-box protein [Phycisphaeraceae bacterium]